MHEKKNLTVTFGNLKTIRIPQPEKIEIRCNKFRFNLEVKESNLRGIVALLKKKP